MSRKYDLSFYSKADWHDHGIRPERKSDYHKNNPTIKLSWPWRQSNIMSTMRPKRRPSKTFLIEECVFCRHDFCGFEPLLSLVFLRSIEQQSDMPLVRLALANSVFTFWQGYESLWYKGSTSKYMWKSLCVANTRAVPWASMLVKSIGSPLSAPWIGR
jgi:hypothetical protein